MASFVVEVLISFAVLIMFVNMFELSQHLLFD